MKLIKNEKYQASFTGGRSKTIMNSIKLTANEFFRDYIHDTASL